MPSAALLRIEIERALEGRFPAALTPAVRTIREVAPTGIAEVDGLLGGSLPVGAISEVTGPESSGRTTLALAFLAQRTQEGKVCAWVDAGDAFDPETAASSGILLRQLLWVRCRENAAQKRARTPENSSHGRTKPGAQIWTRLDQALRATDLLLQAGGFAAIVLDLGDTATDQASRIPLATWFRFRQAADRVCTSLVVLSQISCAQSGAAVALECAPLRAETAGETMLSGLRYEIGRRRERFSPLAMNMRKPPATTWAATCAWNAERSA
ncbi:MAG: hypothetical protein ACLP7O_00370 [Terracidiphilus sp.]